MLQPVERRIERSLLNDELFAGELLDPQQDTVAVQWSKRNSFQDQQIQSSLQQIGLFILLFGGSGVVYAHGRERNFAVLTQESAMKLFFILAVMVLGITTAQGQQQGQTASQVNGQTSSSSASAYSAALSAGALTPSW